MKKLLFLLVCCCMTSTGVAQDHLKNLRNKTARQIANAPKGTFMDSTFFNVRIGDLGRNIVAAIEERALTPYDVPTGTLQAAKDTAVATNVPLLVPWNFTAASLTFSAKDSSLLIIVDGVVNITASDTIPAGAFVQMRARGKFIVASGQNLMIDGEFDSPTSRRRFYGAGTVTLGDQAVREVLANWFGATNADSTLDNGPYIQRAIDASPSGSVVRLLAGRRSVQNSGYLVNTTIRFPMTRNITLRGEGTNVFSSVADTIIVLRNGSADPLPAGAIDPPNQQPRHRIEGIRFKRQAGASTPSGVAIALVNTTGAAIVNCDFYQFKVGVSHWNTAGGWCEKNELLNLRIAAADTGIIYRKTGTGNLSMATNTLRQVTITAFNSSGGVGVYYGPGTNPYRNVYDQLLIFPRDTVKSIYYAGKAEDIIGNAHIEYIGDTERNEMYGIYFASTATEARFRLHLNVTGRAYFNPNKVIYSEMAGSFSYTGITLSFDGNQNHGLEWPVDSSKFTPLFSFIDASRLGVTNPNDSSRLLYGQANNSQDGKIDIRGRRNHTIDLRALRDDVSSSLTHETVDGSQLPLQPVRALFRQTSRTVDDSTTIDVRLATHLIIGSDLNAEYNLTSFTGGIAGQVVTVTWASNFTNLRNLSGASGSGRIWRIDNVNGLMQQGMKSYFICESESGGVYWREMYRTGENLKTLDYAGTVDSVDVAITNYVRMNHSAPQDINNFFNAADGQRVDVLVRTANTTFKHLNRGVLSNEGISLISLADYTPATGTRLSFVYDADDKIWREFSRSEVATLPGATFSWSKTGTSTAGDSIRFAEGANVTLSKSGNVLTITAAGAAGSSFIWSKSGEVTKNDSIRFIEGDNVNLTQSGNTISIATDPRGWTETAPYVFLNATTSQEVRVGATAGKPQVRQLWYDLDGDTLRVRPQPAANKNILEYKDGGTTLANLDSLGVWDGTNFTKNGGVYAVEILKPVGGTALTRNDTLYIQGLNGTTVTSGNDTLKINTPKFQWNKSGETVKYDSVRFAQGANVTLTQSGNVLTIAASAGSGITPAGARTHTGWTAQDGLIASDTVANRIEWGGTENASVKIFDADGDTVLIKPQQNNPFLLKDGGTTLATLDSAGRYTSGGSYNANGTISLDGSGSQPLLYFRASDGDLQQAATTTSDQISFTGASGGYLFDAFIRKPDFLEFLGGALKETAAGGAADTTQNYMPAKAFSVGDTATFDFATSKRFQSLDSVVVIGWSNQASSAVVFNCQIRQVQIGGTIAGAFNASSSKTITTSTAGTLRQWSFTSFGSVTANVFSQIVGKIYRTSGGTGGDVIVSRVLLYGVGLR